MIKMNISKNTQIKGLSVLFLITLIPLIFGLLPNSLESFDNSIENEPTYDIPKLSASLSNFGWWNETWEFRILVNVSANGAEQNNVPVEFLINFTEKLETLDVNDTEFDLDSVRVIEYEGISDYVEVPCQFDPYNAYDNKTNAIGDLVWIMNGTTSSSATRNYMIYFNNNETKSKAPAPTYSTIRRWHEDFEEMVKADGKILSAAGGQDSQPNYYDISTSVSARGNRSLNVWGNCWKAIDPGQVITIDADTYVTAKIRIDDENILRDISGIAFQRNGRLGSLPDRADAYEMRGWQNWGQADAPAPYGPFDDNYYADETFFWYTLNLDDEISRNNFRYIFFVADDDSPEGYNLYWDDVSIWNQVVQTDPSFIPTISEGDAESIAYSVKITCLDEEGNRIQNAHIFISNNLNPLLNQNHTSDENGEWLFTEIQKDYFYNVTVNYTQNGLLTPKTETIYFYENYQITSLKNDLVAFVNLTTINFNVLDYDGAPIQYGYVKLKDVGNNDVGKGLLNEVGDCTIIWKNNSNYNYYVYFDFNSLPDVASYRNNMLEISNGIVNIGTHMVNVSTNFSKVIFNVTQRSDGTPFVAATLRIYNTTDYKQESKILVNITVQSDGSARFFGFNNETLEEWGNYTLEVYFAGDERIFYVDDNLMNDKNFNFTLQNQVVFNLSIDLDMSLYNSTINYIDLSTDIYWGDIITIDFNFTSQDPSSPAETLETPTDLYFQVLDDELVPYSNKVSILSSEIIQGIFSYQFNTTDYSLIGGYNYWIEITGNFKSYVSPEPLQQRFEVMSLPTGISYFDYSLNELMDKRFSVIYREIFNVTVDYFNFNTGDSLNGALITYNWDFGSGVLNDDPIHADLYYH